MSRIAVLDSAMDDVVGLTDSLASYSDAAAGKLTDALADGFEQLSTPQSGRERSEIGVGVRGLTLPRVGVTVYSVYDDQRDIVLITRVLRQERGLE